MTTKTTLSQHIVAVTVLLCLFGAPLVLLIGSRYVPSLTAALEADLPPPGSEMVDLLPPPPPGFDEILSLEAIDSMFPFVRQRELDDGEEAELLAYLSSLPAVLLT